MRSYRIYRRGGIGLILAATCVAFPVGASFAQCELDTLIASDSEAGDQFGSHIEIVGDLAVVAAPHDDDAGFKTGALYVYVRSGIEWVEQAKIVPKGVADSGGFGTSLAISGERIIVGANSDDGPAGVDQGSAFIFRHEKDTWVQEARLLADDAEHSDRFGVVDMDGDTIAIGAPYAHGVGIDSGAVYIYRLQADKWILEQKIFSLEPLSANFGAAVALQGDRLLVGAPETDDAAGAVYVFRRNGKQWNEVAKLTAPEGQEDDEFGTRVVMDGNLALISARYDNLGDGYGEGSAHIFRRQGPAWLHEAMLVGGDTVPGDSFGYSVSLQGEMAAIGMYNNDGHPLGGATYVFKKVAKNWEQIAKLTPENAEEGDRFGWSVGVDGGFVWGGSTIDLNTAGTVTIFAVDGEDCNSNDELDACDIAGGKSNDDDADGIPDECQVPDDGDGDGVPDDADECPKSDLNDVIVIEDCDTMVTNLLFKDGCTMLDLIIDCATGTANHGDFVSCVADLANDWVQQGLITGAEHGSIVSCAAQSSLP
ncbi:MAG: FG-GAP repeat protein [Planctomycetes bacterium]|nr:FG-GAP repeat protein [Planctomycetota bacterium]